MPDLMYSSTINLLRQILKAGQNFIGTHKEMAAFISEHQDLFKQSDLKDGDMVRYKVQDVTLFGRFKYYVTGGLNQGLAVVVREGRTDYINPAGLEKV